jgi:hypothetical protein
MASMALESLGGRIGSNTCLFFFSQPKGVVTTTSSNSRARLLSVEIEMTPEQDVIFVTLVESSNFAPDSAGAAIVARISLYVPAANRFSGKFQYMVFSSSCTMRKGTGGHSIEEKEK